MKKRFLFFAILITLLIPTFSLAADYPDASHGVSSGGITFFDEDEDTIEKKDNSSGRLKMLPKTGEIKSTHYIMGVILLILFTSFTIIKKRIGE